MDTYRILKDGSVQQVDDLLEWAKWFEGSRPDAPVAEGGCCVGRTELAGGVLVLISTVFLGIDHSHSRGGPPILFETMIFGGPRNQYQERYATFEGAEEGHEKAVREALTPVEESP